MHDDLFGSLESHFDQFFNEFFNKSSCNKIKANSGYPKLDVVDEEESWVVKAAVPGVDSDNLKVEILPSVETESTGAPPILKISGKISEEYKSPENSTYYIRELKMSNFSREMYIPHFVEGEPEAELKNGILSLKWKKKEKEKKKDQPKLIEIKKK